MRQDLPQYRCHKVVRAAKILHVEAGAPDRDGALLELEGVGQLVPVDAAFMSKHSPQVGGYFVAYDNGYTSWSPAKAFEDGYSLVPGGEEVFSFGAALALLTGGERVARDGWNGRGMWLELQRPDSGSKMTLPYIYMRTAQGELVPWLASQTDMLAEDWRLLAP